MAVALLSSPKELMSSLEAWDDLALHVIEKNVFYESWMLLPALQHFADNDKVFVALVWNSSTVGDGELIGLFPLEIERSYRRLPLSYFKSWLHPHCYLGTPLVRKNYEEKCFEEIFEWSYNHSFSAGLIQFSRFCADGPFNEALSYFLSSAKQRWEETDEFVRPLLCSDLTSKEYLTTKLTAKQLRNLRRNQKRLEEEGTLSISLTTTPGAPEEWIQAFLNIEESGWKGEQGTALACSKEDRLFFEAICLGAAEREQGIFSSLSLDNEAIAVNCIFTSGTEAFGFKSAYNERYRAYSPGKLLDLHNVQYLLDSSVVSSLDSCCAPQLEYTNCLWQERRKIHSVGVFSKPLGNALLSGLTYLKKMPFFASRSPAYNKTPLDGSYAGQS